MDEAGVHPVRNFQKGRVSGHDEINERRLRSLMSGTVPVLDVRFTVARSLEVGSGKYKGAFTEGPEYETVWAFGAQCDNANLESIVQAEYLCDFTASTASPRGMSSVSSWNVRKRGSGPSRTSDFLFTSVMRTE